MNIEPKVFASPSVLAELTGYSLKTICRDSKRLNWIWKTNGKSPLKLYSIDAVCASYGISSFTRDQIEAAAIKLMRLPIKVERI